MKLFLNKLLFFILILLVNFSCKRHEIVQDNLTEIQQDLTDSNKNESVSFGNAEFIEDSNQSVKSLIQNINIPKASKFDTISVISWNIQHLGKTKTVDEIYFIANLLRNFDIVAIQEVVAKDPAGAQAVGKIVDELNRMGFQWDYQISDPTKSPSSHISERYAFLWKQSRVSIIGRAKLDNELEDICYREPFIAKFKTKGRGDADFFIINYHSRKYNNNPEEEIQHFIKFPSRLNSNKLIIAGDFNLDERHQVWNPFYKSGFKSGLADTKTTLKRKCDQDNYFSHSIDNFYFHSGISKHKAGRIDFVMDCENLLTARGISDHVPVFMFFTISN